MSTVEATVSLMNTMSEEQQLRVLDFAKYLSLDRASSGFATPLSAEEILDKLALSRNQFSQGRGLDFGTAMKEMGRRHGFI